MAAEAASAEKKAATTARTNNQTMSVTAETPPSSSSGASTAGAYCISGSTGDVTVTNGGRGRGRRGGYCGRNHGGKRSDTGRGPSSLTSSNSIRATTTFKGREDAIKGHIYDIINPSTSTSEFITTTEEIAEYAGRTLKMSDHVKDPWNR